MNKPILALITAQPHCVNIIEAAKLMAQGLNRKLCVVTVLPRRELAADRAEKLKTLKAISEISDVDIIIRYSDNPPASAATQAFESEPLHIFMGEDNGFLSEFLSFYNGAPVSVVSKKIIFTVPSGPKIKGA